MNNKVCIDCYNKHQETIYKLVDNEDEFIKEPDNYLDFKFSLLTLLDTIKDSRKFVNYTLCQDCEPNNDKRFKIQVTCKLFNFLIDNLEVTLNTFSKYPKFLEVTGSKLTEIQKLYGEELEKYYNWKGYEFYKNMLIDIE